MKIGHLSRNCPDKVNKNTELIDAAKAGSAVDESSASEPTVSAIPASTVIEPLEGASSAEVRVFSPVDHGVVAESLAAENARFLSVPRMKQGMFCTKLKILVFFFRKRRG
ncbi:hypothetical protein F2P79_009205 [Pimephales promelas]|nr:hypothetical protein F2P79_009205 [Pimephales promelas]